MLKFGEPEQTERGSRLRGRAGTEARIEGQSREAEAQRLGDAAVEMCIVI